MEKIIIVGAGGFALEAIDLIDSINSVKLKYEIIGFLDDFKKDIILEKYVVLGKVSDWINYKKHSFVIAISNPQNRESIFKKLKSNNIHTPNLIHPLTEISKYAILKEDSGIFVNYSVQISAKVKIEESVILDSKVYVGHETIISPFVTVYPGVNISGNNLINERSEIGLGTNVIQGLVIGSNSIIGAGSTVIKSIQDNVVAVGTPCKPIKER